MSITSGRGEFAKFAFQINEEKTKRVITPVFASRYSFGTCHWKLNSNEHITTFNHIPHPENCQVWDLELCPFPFGIRKTLSTSIPITFVFNEVKKRIKRTLFIIYLLEDANPFLELHSIYYPRQLFKTTYMIFGKVQLMVATHVLDFNLSITTIT